MPQLILHRPPPPSPMRGDSSPVANLFGGSLGVTLNKRQSIEREKSGHTPARKKHGNPTRRVSSVRARVANQEALAAEMSSLHINNSFNAPVAPSDKCRTMIVTPNGHADEECVKDSDDDDYDPAPVSNPASKPRSKKVPNKNSNSKLVLDRNFMC